MRLLLFRTNSSGVLTSLGLGLLTLCLPGSAAGLSSAHCSANGGAQQQMQDFAVGQAICVLQVGNPPYRSDANSNVNVGDKSLHVQAVGFAQGDGQGSIGGVANAQYTLSAEFDIGTVFSGVEDGFLTGSVEVSGGGLQATASGFEASASSFLRWTVVAGGSVFNGRCDRQMEYYNGALDFIYEDNPGCDFGHLSFTIPWSVNFTTPVSFYAWAQASGNAYDGTANARADMSNTIAWGGITSVTDSSGNAIPFTAIDPNTGVDWATPAAIPEPATAVLLLTGLAALAARRGS